MTTYIRTAIRLVIETVIAILVFSPAVARADVLLDWNAIMETTVGPQSPFAQARFAAITQLAVFEAVNAITGDYEPYLGTITAPANASAEAAVIAAAHTVLRNYFPGNATSLDAARASSLAMIADGPAKTAGIAAGEASARALIAARANDGSAPAEFYLPSSSNPGKWQLTPSCPNTGGLFLQWRNITPFGIRSGDQFRLHAPPALTSAKYARDYNELKQVGGLDSTDRPPDRANVARFYAAVSAVGLFNPVARQLSTAQSNSLSQNARLFALLNMAISDGAVATFDTKYHYNFWRPETAIHMGNTDGSAKTAPDPSYAPFIVTPCFPGYPSAHATLSNAAREVLERIFDRQTLSIVLSTPAVPNVTLRYTNLQEITDDIDDARVYGGIHFRFEQEAGADLGRRVGDYVLKNNLRPAGACNCQGK